MDIIEQKIFEFVGWIYQSYGRLGCGLALLLIIAVFTGVFVLLNRLPEQKAEGDNRAE